MKELIKDEKTKRFILYPESCFVDLGKKDTSYVQSSDKPPQMDEELTF